MGSIILFNVILMLVEANERAPCERPGREDQECEKTEITVLNHVLLGIYTVECAIRLFVDRG
eukprot:14266047-Heterocapsa_arctica.AAC.1